MSIHVTGLEQILLSRKMEREMDKQRALPPRWKGPMIFPTMSAAILYVEQSGGLSGRGANAWRHASTIVAMTHDYFCSYAQATYAANTIVALLEGRTYNENPDQDVTITGNCDEIVITFHVAEETHENRFACLNGEYVPVPS